MNTFDDFTLCGRCYGLTGQYGDCHQLCGCATEQARHDLAEENLRRGSSRWSRLASLCHCCGAEVLDASQKYAFWFCPRCRANATTVNRALGYCAIPVGWHSIVNRVFVETSQARTRPGATAAADQLNAFLRESRSVSDWAHEIVVRQWHRAGLPEGEMVGVGEYLSAVWAKDVDKERLFGELVAARGIPDVWRAPEAIPLALVWAQQHGGALEATEEIVWLCPGDEYDYAELTLKVTTGPYGSWRWCVVLDQKAAGDADPTLADGRAATEEEAKSACAAATGRLIENAERKAHQAEQGAR